MTLRKKGRSSQELMGIKGFTAYGLSTSRGELVFYLVQPTNISVLSAANVEIKVRHLKAVLQAAPDIELVCLDSCECFDENVRYIKERLYIGRDKYGCATRFQLKRLDTKEIIGLKGA